MKVVDPHRFTPAVTPSLRSASAPTAELQQDYHSRPDSEGTLKGPCYTGRAEPGEVSGGNSLEALDLAKRVVELAEDKQAADIVLLDIRPISPVADYFVVCSGNSDRQISALTRDVTATLKREAQVAPLRTEGSSGSGWILLDYGDVVVHVFAPAEREYYRLEELWGAALPVIRIQ